MNAPASPAQLKPNLQLVALTDLVPSKTHVQELRRARFTKESLKELADNILAVGIQQHPVVRPVKGDKFEIVAGERRWLASKLIPGVKEIYVSVRELSDDQLLEIQLTENLLREDLHELEEAEGYEELMKAKKIDADGVADLMGISRSQVYARTKLLALSPEIRKEFYAGKMNASEALLIARIPHHDLQRQAVKELEEAKSYNDVSNFKEAQAFIRDRFMLQLKIAPFKLDDETLIPKAGSCIKCPKRTGNQHDLFADVANADVCTDPKCFAEKRKAGEAKLLTEYKDKGVKVLVGDEAKRVLPGSDTYASGGYHLAGDTCYEDPKRRKVSAIVDDDAMTLVKSPNTGRMIKVASSAAITAALNAKGIKTQAQKSAEYNAKVRSQSAKSRENGDEREKIDGLVNQRIVEAALKKAPTQLGKPELLQLAEVVWRDSIGTLMSETIADVGKALGYKITRQYEPPLPAEVNKLDVKGLARFTMVCLAAGELEARAGSAIKLLKIDPKAIEKQVRAELKATQAEALKAAKAAAPAKGKTGTAWPFPIGKKAPIGKPKAKAKKKPAAKKAKGKKK